MRTRFLVSISFALGLALAGCSSNGSGFAANLEQPTQAAATRATAGTSRSVNWSEFGFIPSGGRFNPHERMLSTRNVHRLHKRWSSFTGCSGSICGGSSPAVVNGVVYVGSYDGNVYAFNAVTGAKLWSFPTGGEVFSTPAVANGVVYVGSNDQNVYALNAATGAKLWSYATTYDVTSSPAVANGMVYIGSEDGKRVRAQSRQRGKGVVLRHPPRHDSSPAVGQRDGLRRFRGWQRVRSERRYGR